MQAKPCGLGQTAPEDISMNHTNNYAATPARSMKKIAAASVIGTTVEWYDLFLFATASALVFNKIFFPAFDP